MKRPIIFLLLFLSLLTFSTPAKAYNFVVGGIYYNRISGTDKQVEVTSGTVKYSGAVVIPSTVENEGTTYSVTSIGSSAFSNCSELTSVIIPNSVTSIGNSAFFGCSALTSATIGEGVTTIGTSAFSDCSELTSVTIPNSVTSIEDFAFYRCSGLTSVTIGEGVTTIGFSAFSYCSGLESVTIPNSVTSIGAQAFLICSGLTSVTIGEGVTSIGGYAFDGCSSLTSVTIPDSVTSIGDAAFYNCSGLTSVEWNAINCEDCAHYSTTFPCNLTAITFGDKVAHIPAYLCSGCSGLTSVTIPENVTSIGKGALGGIGLRSVEWNAINCKDFTQSSIAFPNFLTSITFGDKVEHIPAYLCYEWSGLTSVAIPNSVTSIGMQAFSGCSSLTSVTIPENVTSVKKCAFSGCTGLRSVEWNAINCQDVDRASDRPFYECAKITAITFGNQVSHIPAFLCYEWSGLKSVTIPNSVTSIGEYAFSGCSGLTSVMIPNGVTTIDYGTFGRCSGLTSVTIGEGVASIGGSAFFGCSALTSVTIPENVTSIGDAAFYDCSDLTSVTSLAETPPSCSSDAFSVHDTLYVPCGCKTAYQTATGWLSFSKIIELECKDIVTDTLYFEFALEEGASSAIIEYRFLNTVLSGIEMEYYDGEAHSKFSPDAEGSITVNGNGHGRIYYTYAPGDTYGASFEPIEESAESLQAEDVRRDVRGGG